MVAPIGGTSCFQYGMAQVILESTITCPNCSAESRGTMPVDACVHFYTCPGCMEVLKPENGDCCVYCSFGTVACPPKQAGRSDCRSDQNLLLLRPSRLSTQMNEQPGDPLEHRQSACRPPQLTATPPGRPDVAVGAEAGAVMKPCAGCGVVLPEEDGPVHRYMESSSACWRLYGEVLAREYSDARYRSIHRLTVDAYAAQHPGRESPQSTQSVALHLISLCMILEQHWPPERVTSALQQIVERRKELWWLEPPAHRGDVTVADVHAISTRQAHETVVRLWARSVWESWARHHATVQAWMHNRGAAAD